MRRTIGDRLDLRELGRARDELLAQERPPDGRVLLLDGGQLGHVRSVSAMEEMG